jgi:hypothetical protein
MKARPATLVTATALLAAGGARAQSTPGLVPLRNGHGALDGLIRSLESRSSGT